jgi:hypothetical protein
MRDDATRRLRFREKLRQLIERKTRQPQGTAEILRVEVEVVGASLGMSEDKACNEFLSLRGSLWDLRTGNVFDSMIPSARGEAPPRNWFAFTDVYLRASSGIIAVWLFFFAGSSFSFSRQSCCKLERNASLGASLLGNVEPRTSIGRVGTVRSQLCHIDIRGKVIA